MEDKGFEQVIEEILEPAPGTVKPVTPAEETSLVDEIIFGTNEDQAFAPAQETKKVEPGVEQKPVTKESKNNEAQFQYWQSQTDKARNENIQMKQELDKLKHDIQSTVVEPKKEKEQEVEEFPAPPLKPEQPQGFNMEEAYTDQLSLSAKYLNSKEQWRDDMDQYNSLKTEYNAAINQQYLDKMTQQQKQQREAYEMQARQKAVIDNVRSTVVSQYGADQTTVDDFIKEMSKPEALSIENLWKLYNLNAGKQPGVTPSPDFQQTQQMQYVPSPMGVMPSAETQANSRSPEDMIMDGMINEYEGKQPFK